MTREEAIRILDPETTGEALAEIEYYNGFSGKTAAVQAVSDACVLAIAALRTQQEQTPCSRCGYGGKHLDAPPCKTCPAHPKGQESNAPLTLDELREMDGEPVWVQSPGIPEYGRWAIVEGVGENSLFLHDDFTCHDYGKTWLAYRQKPEEAVTICHQMTNADRIRSMSDEELAEFISSIPMCVGKVDEDLNCEIDVCKECFLKWLQQPAEGDGHA